MEKIPRLFKFQERVEHIYNGIKKVIQYFWIDMKLKYSSSKPFLTARPSTQQAPRTGQPCPSPQPKSEPSARHSSPSASSPARTADLVPQPLEHHSPACSRHSCHWCCRTHTRCGCTAPAECSPGTSGTPWSLDARPNSWNSTPCWTCVASCLPLPPHRRPRLCLLCRRGNTRHEKGTRVGKSGQANLPSFSRESSRKSK